MDDRLHSVVAHLLRTIWNSVISSWFLFRNQWSNVQEGRISQKSVFLWRWKKVWGFAEQVLLSWRVVSSTLVLSSLIWKWVLRKSMEQTPKRWDAMVWKIIHFAYVSQMSAHLCQHTLGPCWGWNKVKNLQCTKNSDSHENAKQHVSNEGVRCFRFYPF